jgi:hypothetical protein
MLAEASNKITQNMESSFRQAATAEVEADIDKVFLDILNDDPYQLATKSVPDIRPGAANDAKVTLRDSSEAKAYQESLAKLVKAEIDDVVKQKTDQIRPLMSVTQESALLLQSNPDLIPDTDKYDPELAALVYEVGKSYELKVNDKVIGFQVPMQPIINKLRGDLEKSRGVDGVVQQQMSAQQQRAAEQAREQDGKFAGPQGGILSKQNASGEGGEDEYSTFWSSVGMEGMGLNL